MYGHFGHQAWWPGETPFEVCVGAILTQNTNWVNVELALGNLKGADVLSPAGMYGLAETELARFIRPAGYFNIKARRLRSFLKALIGDFGADLKRMLSGNTPSVRERLLAINGIGPETADCILLYAGNHHSFVVDAYTRRIFERHGWLESDGKAPSPSRAKGNDRKTYETIQTICADALNEKPANQWLDYWQDYHAQLVRVGKHFCRKREARCNECPLKPLLPNEGGIPNWQASRGEAK
jgi:endonuclease-3 related protein